MYYHLLSLANYRAKTLFLPNLNNKITSVSENYNTYPITLLPNSNEIEMQYFTSNNTGRIIKFL